LIKQIQKDEPEMQKVQPYFEEKNEDNVGKEESY
jgi:hypothetical protein